MRQRLNRDGSRGLSLLELVVAITVLAIGTLAALRATDQSRRAISMAPVRLMAQVVAENRAEQWRLLGPAAAGLPARVENGGQIFVIQVDTRTTAGGLIEAQITARAATNAAGTGAPGAVLVAYLPARGQP